MSMRKLRADARFEAPGSTGRWLRKAPGATHCQVLCYPLPAADFPPGDGLTRSHPELHFTDDALPGGAAFGDYTTHIMGGADLTDLFNCDGGRLPIPAEAAGFFIRDGGGDGTTAITRGVVIWYQDDSVQGQSLAHAAEV